jgi:hypothetical protein
MGRSYQRSSALVRAQRRIADECDGLHASLSVQFEKFVEGTRFEQKEI